MALFNDLERGLITSQVLRRKRFEILFSEFDMKMDIDDFSNAYLENLARGSMLLDGSEAVIHALYSGHKMLLVTNGIGVVQRPRFERSGLRSYFEDVLISDEVGVAKPSFEFFKIAFERMGHPPRKAVMIIGDSLTSDMAGGIQYGIDTCWFNPGQKENHKNLKVNYEITALQQLLAIVR